jgi:nitrous oxidase accessory protein
MERNWFAEQQGPATYGLLLKEISDSTVACNRFEQNSVGVHMDQSNRNGIRGNDFAHNGLALSLWGSAEGNRFEANTFRGNLFDVYTNTTSSGNNSFANNYFAAYTGYDRDRDGKGDLPFRPVSYSAVLLARYPLAGLLVKSLFFELLDTAERLIPAFAPVELGDPSPSLRPIDCAN